ncbi:putative methyltransferase-domain-containing protein [Xylaria nigripes]|nr:putative methyltransferase-domain-containing protein [Xylaria nigripes]
MHYIRLLRPAKIQSTRQCLVLSLLFTITTDLGDSFLCPEEGSLDLIIALVDSAPSPADSTAGARRQSLSCICSWKAGMRVLDAKVNLWPEIKQDSLNCRVMIHPKQQAQHPRDTSARLGTLHICEVLPWRIGAMETIKMGVIMPATFEIVNGACASVSLRTLAWGKSQMDKIGDDHQLLQLGFEEDIGESIARHIWDAGVVTSAYLADACSSPDSIRDLMPIENESFNVLELGSGVGILGITIASILPRAAATQGKTLKNAKVLLTDLEEAAERAKSNVAKAEPMLVLDDTLDTKVSIEYENLDWDEGCEGLLGSLAAATQWDLVVLSDCTYNVDSLPALIGTLGTLHAAKRRHHGANDDSLVKSSVLLATKPRHSSEQALFELLQDQEWTYRVVKEIPLPKIGDEDEVVQIYLLEKRDHVA